MRDLEVKLDPSGTSVRLAWQPVTQDVNGRSEYVARYQVYRYNSRGIFPRVRPYLIGVTETPEFVDDAPLAHPGLYYRVLAEDEAGNALGVRD